MICFVCDKPVDATVHVVDGVKQDKPKDEQWAGWSFEDSTILSAHRSCLERFEDWREEQG